MRGRLYRGTTFQQAKREEFNDRHIHGDTFDSYEGWMAPDDADGDLTGQPLDELPWEVGPPERNQASVTGGISDRLGAAASFAGGGLAVVFHLDASEIPNLARVRYDQGWFDRHNGALAWVHGGVDGELRVNGDLKGLTNDSEEGTVVAKYGDSLGRYADELEQVAIGTDSIDIGGAVQGVVSYVRRPIAHLSSLDGYERLDTRMTEPEDTVVGDYSDEEAASVLYDEFRAAVPGDWDAYVVHTNTMLVKETWGYDEREVEAVYGDRGRMAAEDAPEFILGD